MVRIFRSVTILLSLIAFLSVPVFAQLLSVRNQPYQGEVLGRGTEALVRLDQMAEVLELPVEQREAEWTLGEVAIPVVEQNGQVYVRIADLEPAGVKVVLNSQLNTLDLYRAQATARSAESEAAWAGASAQVTMLYFSTPRCGVCKKMKPAVNQFRSNQPVNVVEVDMDNRNSEHFKKYSDKFEGSTVPFSVVLDSKGRTVHKFRGYRSYSELVKELDEYLR